MIKPFYKSYNMSELLLETESDVEQKFIYPLLTTLTPIGLGYLNSDIRTKLDIRKIQIDKGSKSKIYYPDYMVVMDGLPLVIIEAKTPNDDLIEAIREARLYAMELNSQYPNNINPCSKIIVSNGVKTIAQNFDSELNSIMFLTENKDVSNPDFFNFLNFLKKEVVENFSRDVLKSIRKDSRYTKPLFQLGGKIARSESVGENSFGVNLSLDYRFLFNPISNDERTEIVKNAYVPSKKRLTQVDHIDRIIRMSMKNTDSNQIFDTSKPKEIIELFDDKQKLKHQVCYLIGSVGSGKSTFTDYIREVALPDEIKKQTFWININLNNAPTDSQMIYHWIMNSIIEGIKEKSDVDIDDFSITEKVFASLIVKFKKGPVQMLLTDIDSYNKQVYEEYMKLLSDKPLYIKMLINYLFNSRDKLLIIVLDNCDKRDKNTQLLMFDVANWIKETFSCMLFLPLRDTTFDNYRKQPPLDTIIKDFVFRIDPPLLDRVLYERFKYALRVIGSDNRDFYYRLNNSMKVVCKRSDVVNYLHSILNSLFQNIFFKKLISGLAGRDIRKGLEIFLDFCKSGHITEDEIFKMRQSKGDYSLPNHIISRIILRGTNKYYNDENSIVKNLFHSYRSDEIPNPFVRQAILIWLKNRYGITGPNSTKGFHKMNDLIKELQSFGHNRNRIIEEISSLSKAGCVYTESPDGVFQEDDLISIAPGGFVHLELVKNIDYLSSVAEDTYFKNPDIAQKIANNMIGKNHPHMSKQSSLENADELIKYMNTSKDLFVYKPEYFLDGEIEKLDLLQEINEFIVSAKGHINLEDNVEYLVKEYPIGSSQEGEIASIQSYGIFIEFGLKGRALIHKSNIHKYEFSEFDLGDPVSFEIIEFSVEHNRFIGKC